MELEKRVIKGVPLRVSPRMAEAGVAHGFTTRLGGVSGGIYASLNLGMNRGDDPAKVRENYRRVCEALGVEMGKLVFSGQVHQAEVRKVTLADGGTGLERKVDYDADGLITDEPGLWWYLERTALPFCFAIRNGRWRLRSMPGGGGPHWGSRPGQWRPWSGTMAVGRRTFWLPLGRGSPDAALRQGRRSRRQ